MISMMALSAWYHRQLEYKALYIKIEKLEAWMRMYRDGKITGNNSKYAIEIMGMIYDTQREQTKLLNNK